MKTKKILCVILAFVLIAAISMGAVSAANYNAIADELKSLGLFLGTDSGYELDREPRRTEAAVMLVRLLGKEAEAREENFAHPFTDVPEWADFYVGYLYENGLTKGIGNNLFGSAGLCDATMFSAFVLRALGYTEEAGDFVYAEATDFAEELGLFDFDMHRLFKFSPFLRAHCVYIMYNALTANIKGTDITLLERLAEDGAVDEELAEIITEKIILNAELNELLKSSIGEIETELKNRPFYISVEIKSGSDSDSEEKYSGYLAVTAENLAVVSADFAIYYTDGYIYADNTQTQTKHKAELDPFDIFDGIDFQVRGIARILGSLADGLAPEIVDIEKASSDKTIAFAVGTVFDEVLIFVFDPDFISIYIGSSEDAMTIVIVTGEDAVTDLPDLSGYIESDEEINIFDIFETTPF